MEWTRQLIKCQMFVTMQHQGPLQAKLLQALLRLARRNERGNPDTPIGFMDHIEGVFEDEGMYELHGNSEHKLITIDGCKTAQNYVSKLEIHFLQNNQAKQGDSRCLTHGIFIKKSIDP